MKFTAYVKYKPTGKLMLKSDEDYKTKSAFVNDLRRNEYIVYRCEIGDVYDFVLSSTNCEDEDFDAARLAYKRGELNWTGFKQAKQDLKIAKEKKLGIYIGD